MAVYKIFPSKDTTLYSLFPNMNTGLDPIIEATQTSFTPGTPDPQSSRFLVAFDSNKIEDILENKMGVSASAQLQNTSSYQINLQCFISTATGVDINPTGTLLEIYYISQDWSMGTGQYLDDPISTDGATWYWVNYSGSTAWQTIGFPTGVTASFTGSGTDRDTNNSYAGGGTWYTGSTNSDWNSNLYPISASQTFNYSTDKDLNVTVTNIIGAWYTGSISNAAFNGFIIKQNPEFVYNKNYQPELKYFSVDTNTIYPPALQFSWRDFTWATSSNVSVLTTLPARVALNQNPGFFYSQSVNVFRVNAAPEYPAAVWQTSSLYTENYYLPQESYYAIKDLSTNEYVIEFDTRFTQLSADTTGSYFKLYMNGLQPERYYQVLIQTTINGSTLVYNDGYYFKVING
jgi:hypothetical protein